MGSGKYSERRVTDVYSDGSDRSGLFCELVGMDTSWAHRRLARQKQRQLQGTYVINQAHKYRKAVVGKFKPHPELTIHSRYWRMQRAVGNHSDSDNACLPHVIILHGSTNHNCGYALIRSAADRAARSSTFLRLWRGPCSCETAHASPAALRMTASAPPLLAGCC